MLCNMRRWHSLSSCVIGRSSSWRAAAAVTPLHKPGPALDQQANPSKQAEVPAGKKGKSRLLVVADIVRRMRDTSTCKLWLLQDEAPTDDGTSLKWQRQQASRHAAPSTAPLRNAGDLILIGNWRRMGTKMTADIPGSDAWVGGGSPVLHLEPSMPKSCLLATDQMMKLKPFGPNDFPRLTGAFTTPTAPSSIPGNHFVVTFVIPPVRLRPPVLTRDEIPWVGRNPRHLNKLSVQNIKHCQHVAVASVPHGSNKASNELVITTEKWEA